LDAAVIALLKYIGINEAVSKVRDGLFSFYGVAYSVIGLEGEVPDCKSDY